jgi:hypothetical protein
LGVVPEGAGVPCWICRSGGFVKFCVEFRSTIECEIVTVSCFHFVCWRIWVSYLFIFFCVCNRYWGLGPSRCTFCKLFLYFGLPISVHVIMSVLLDIITAHGLIKWVFHITSQFAMQLPNLMF